MFWIANIVLFSVAGAALVLSQVAPCYWGHDFVIGAVLGLDLLLIAMYMFVLVNTCTPHYATHIVIGMSLLRFSVLIISYVCAGTSFCFTAVVRKSGKR